MELGIAALVAGMNSGCATAAYNTPEVEPARKIEVPDLKIWTFHTDEGVELPVRIVGVASAYDNLCLQYIDVNNNGKYDSDIDTSLLELVEGSYRAYRPCDELFTRGQIK